jgi:hypothetical protein
MSRTLAVLSLTSAIWVVGAPLSVHAFASEPNPLPSGCYEVYVDSPTTGQHPSIEVCLPAR